MKECVVLITKPSDLHTKQHIISIWGPRLRLLVGLKPRASKKSFGCSIIVSSKLYEKIW